MNKFRLISAIFAMTGALVACGDEMESTGTGNDGSGNVSGESVALTFNNLPQLGSDYEYEGWVIVEGESDPVSVGRFTSDGSETLEIEQDLPEDMVVEAYVLSIEPVDDSDPKPSDVKVLGGAIANGNADLGIGHPAALADDFTTASGTFILATPSSAAMDDDAQGVWFLDPNGGPGPSLNLPSLTDNPGWTYEGWLVNDDGPLSIGTFDDVAMADSNGAGPAAGTDGVPQTFPGEDFIDPARDLTTGYTVVISVEPVPDDSAEPFRLKPLAKPIDGTLVGGANPQTLDNGIADNGISGSATIQ